MKSAFSVVATGLHVAVILDGNGRWARARGRPRAEGHRAGVEAVRRAVEAAPGLGIGTLTLYAFSSDNWKRPPTEVAALMGLLRRYLRTEATRCVENGVRVGVIGRRDRLDPAIVRALEESEAATRRGANLHLRLAVDYSARDAIVRAATEFSPGPPGDRDAFAARLAAAQGESSPAPDVDLLIRTGGDQRLSDFLLWECAYAELLFVPVPWPAFTPAHLRKAVTEFARRERRFGGLRPLPSPVALARP